MIGRAGGLAAVCLWVEQKCALDGVEDGRDGVGNAWSWLWVACKHMMLTHAFTKTRAFTRTHEAHTVPK